MYDEAFLQGKTLQRTAAAVRTNDSEMQPLSTDSQERLLQIKALLAAHSEDAPLNDQESTPDDLD